MSVALLLVEDDPRIRSLLQSSLQATGIDVTAVACGRDALRALASEPSRFHVLLSDIRLGDNIDGWEVARRARAGNGSIAVIYMSGDSADAWPIEGVSDSRVIIKPFGPRAVPDALAALLPERAHRPTDGGIGRKTTSA